jgi:hypothetical protein
VLVAWSAHLRANDEPVPWSEEEWHIPFTILSLLHVLMVFFLVFFIDQCYNRFSTFLGLCLDIETAVHDSSLMILAFAEPGWAKQQHNPRAGAGAQARSWQ